ncbi:NYN domain-containing protein [Trichocoleus sp. FACHB-262]|uniref:NYN domain-containing protein n=1 Tax=Trichocoleus sp. FACHB-262 TaxID=2692869 RepID=UPI001682FB8B|nr:NYN domain-containing protein [Trichocoleus sp. FACHB-262]MBD2123282.1 NYN domain-containing protein [Trichocoleus sp. FACHB-262]
MGANLLESSSFIQLKLEISQLLPLVELPQEFEWQSSNGTKSQSANAAKVDSGSNTSPAIAILLLDAENLQIDVKTEQFLAQNCAYPIQIKIAFANWRNMGKQDVELHKRGYELIHVPAGKDSADVKMATVGSSIFVHYPTAKEVLVCSSDRVMTHLCTTLKTHGLTVYLVHKQEKLIQVWNPRTGKTEIFNPEKSVEIHSLNDCIGHLKRIMQDEQQNTGNQWVELVKVSKKFQQENGFTISQVTSKHLPGKKARELFSSHPEHFVIHQLPNQTGLYVALFQSEELGRGKQESLNSREVETTHQQTTFKVSSSSDLEKALLNLFHEMAAQSKQPSIPLTLLGDGFRKQHGQAVNTVLKEKLKLTGNLTKFLQNSDAFKLELSDKGWQVAIAAKTQK